MTHAHAQPSLDKPLKQKCWVIYGWGTFLICLQATRMLGKRKEVHVQSTHWGWFQSHLATKQPIKQKLGML